MMTTREVWRNQVLRISEGVKKKVFIVLGPFRMALFPELWNAGRHRLDNRA